MKAGWRARFAGFALGALVMSTGLLLSLEFGALGHSLVAVTLSAVMDHRTDAVTDAQLESLLDQLGHASNPEARVHSARRLARSHDGRAVACLRTSLEDRDARVQLAAALALAEIADASAEADLRSLLATSGDPEVRHAAAFAVDVIHHRSHTCSDGRGSCGPTPVAAQSHPSAQD
jgi:HEAT repeat protein